MKPVLVFDIGGTCLRYAVIRDGKILYAKKHSSPSFCHLPKKASRELVNILMSDILDGIKDVKEQGYRISDMVVAMPGMVTGNGTVITAPPLWGNKVRNVPLQKTIRAKTGIRTAVINDLIGTAIFYSELPAFCTGAGLMMVITLSTGIGCKTIGLDDRRLIMGSDGLGGEIGHVTLDHSKDALPCDCGGKGHLSSYLSGRGIVRLIKSMAKRYPGEYRRSNIDSKDSPVLTKNFVEALKRGDPFACKVLNVGVEKLAELMGVVSQTIGVDRYVLVGPLAFSMRKDLQRAITRKLKDCKMFGWSKGQIDKLVKIGFSDDNSGMLGSAKYCVKGR